MPAQIPDVIAVAEKHSWRLADTMMWKDGTNLYKFEKANKMQTEKALLIFEQDNGSMEYKIKDFLSGEEKQIQSNEILNFL